ncbi:MAG: ribonuclease domain-containing protein [Ornithinibacter sp.]
MPSPSSRARRASPLVLAAVAVLVVALVALGLSLTRGTGSTVGDGSAAAAPTGSSASVATASSGSSTPVSGLPRVAESALPDEADTTLALIRAGGPFPYEEDDGVFGNRERLLPRQPGGYYREFTVETPGEADRGPRRIITGADGDLYWTTDHYASFRQVEEDR